MAVPGRTSRAMARIRRPPAPHRRHGVRGAHGSRRAIGPLRAGGPAMRNRRLQRALVTTPTSVEQTLAPPDLGGVPAEPGVYAWWIRAGALISAPAPEHPSAEGWRLLYLGIAPSREASTQRLRSRVVGNHLRGNIGSSTFRF